MSLFVNFLLTSALHCWVQEAAYASIKRIEGLRAGRFCPVTPFGDAKLGRDVTIRNELQYRGKP